MSDPRPGARRYETRFTMELSSATRNSGPQWQPTTTGDPRLRTWLESDGSLTRRLRRLGGGDFQLEVMGEGWEPSSREDLLTLDSSASRVRVRQVRLTARGIPLVFASTRMPPETLARHSWLGRLGHKPLGEALADRPDVQRTPFEFAMLPPGHPLMEAALEGTDILPGSLWCRRSRFVIGASPIMVYEVFMPGLASFGNH
jgi:chorismate--pyruvate lyase